MQRRRQDLPRSHERSEAGKKRGQMIVVNVQIAKTIGLTVSDKLLVAADEVID
jgi:hypothetical protein